MAFFIFLNPVELHLQNKTDPLHKIPSSLAAQIAAGPKRPGRFLSQKSFG
jgi:hypothetical protein